MTSEIVKLLFSDQNSKKFLIINKFRGPIVVVDIIITNLPTYAFVKEIQGCSKSIFWQIWYHSIP